MKSLNEYPTPECDRAQTLQAYLTLAQSLEQRLAACRKALENVYLTSSSTRLQRLAYETFTATKPQ